MMRYIYMYISFLYTKFVINDDICIYVHVHILFCYINSDVVITMPAHTSQLYVTNKTVHLILAKLTIISILI